jgi:hypothetical protein
MAVESTAARKFLPPDHQEMQYQEQKHQAGEDD